MDLRSGERRLHDITSTEQKSFDGQTWALTPDPSPSTAAINAFQTASEKLRKKGDCARREERKLFTTPYSLSPRLCPLATADGMKAPRDVNSVRWRARGESRGAWGGGGRVCTQLPFLDSSHASTAHSCRVIDGEARKPINVPRLSPAPKGKAPGETPPPPLRNSLSPRSAYEGNKRLWYQWDYCTNAPTTKKYSEKEHVMFGRLLKKKIKGEIYFFAGMLPIYTPYNIS